MGLMNMAQAQKGASQGPAVSGAAEKQQSAVQGQQNEAKNLQSVASAHNRTATSNGQYNEEAHGVLVKHLQGLPPAQKQFISAYLTPETLTLMGIVVGAEVYDTLKPFTDPSKMAIVVPRNNDQQGQAPQPLLQQNSQQAQQPQQAPATAQAGQQAAGQTQPTPQA
jgi:hypothetical protein